MGEDESTMIISSKITPKMGLEFLEAFLVSKIDLTNEFKLSARALGRMEAYEDTLKAFDQIMKRTKISKKADRSHSKRLAEN